MATMTVRQLGEAWTSGKLFERYGSVNRLRVKVTADIDGWILGAHAYEIRTRGPSGPTFGDLSVASVTSDDVATVMASHPKALSARTVTITYQCLRRLFDLAIMPCKLRKEGDSPVLRYFRPERDPEKLFCFLYPDEVLTLLQGKGADGRVVVPLGRRVLYSIATYTGQRKGSLFALRWKHVDFDRGTMASFKTKTGRAQYWVADPGLMAILKAWKAHKGTSADDEPIVSDGDVGYERKRLATALRDDLKAVGVTRSILFEDEAPNVEPLRFHDLRATFCTWARRSGKSDAWISERTGHDIEANMIARYDRGATTLEDLAYGPFPDISHAVPELVEITNRLHTPLHTRDRNGSGGTGGNKAETSIIPAASKQSGREDLNLRPLDPQAGNGRASGIQVPGIASPDRSDSVPLEAPRDPLCNELCNANPDVEPSKTYPSVDVGPTDAELERAIVQAVTGGAFDVARVLSGQLEDRRRGRVGNVVDLNGRRGR